MIGLDNRKLVLFLTFISLAFILTACVLGIDEPADTPVAEEMLQPAATSAAYPDTAGAYPVEGYPAAGAAVVDQSVAPQESGEIPQFPGKLAFHSERTGLLQIFVLDGASGAIEPLIVMPTQAFEPDWAPDCKGLVYSAGGGGAEGFDVYINREGGELLEPLANDPGLMEWAPVWSPVGDIIAYQNNADSLLNVCFKDASGTDLGCLDRGEWSNAMPAWSPDGTQLVFGSNREGNWELYLTAYPPDGEEIRLTENTIIDFYPDVSPDGTRIVFASQAQGNYDIFTMNLDGSDLQQLTQEPADDTTPAWVGDEMIAFSSFRSVDWDLYLMNDDGSNVQRLTYEANRDEWPIWCEAG